MGILDAGHRAHTHAGFADIILFAGLFQLIAGECQSEAVSVLGQMFQMTIFIKRGCTAPFVELVHGALLLRCW